MGEWRFRKLLAASRSNLARHGENYCVTVKVYNAPPSAHNNASTNSYLKSNTYVIHGNTTFRIANSGTAQVTLQTAFFATAIALFWIAPAQAQLYPAKGTRLDALSTRGWHTDAILIA